MLMFSGSVCLTGASAQTALTNLALGKTFTASSSKGDNTAAKAGDGDRTSRWESNYDDSEWIYVDLGAQHNVSCVKIYWETACASSYEIQYSNDAVNWTACYSTAKGNGGIETDSFAAVSARYIKMNGVKRATGYGYSIYEFEVYEQPTDSAPATVSVSGDYQLSIPTSGTTAKQYSAAVTDQYGLAVIGKTVTWNIQPATAGVSIGQNGLVTVSSSAKSGRFTVTAGISGITGSQSVKLSAESPIEQRIDKIMSKMTLQQKLQQMYGYSSMSTADDTDNAIPGFRFMDSPRGARVCDGWAINGSTSSSFPTNIAMANTWDPSLIEQVAGQIAKEVRAHGGNQGLGPAIDLVRDPRAGRAQETGGEDPYLDGQIAVSYVNGYQTNSVIATLKHYNLNTEESYIMDRGQIDDTADQRSLVEYYGAPFRAAVRQSHAMSVMAAYNLVNGEHCASSYNLLQTILRNLFGFKYEVVSDWGALHSAQNGVLAGLNVQMPSDGLYQSILTTDLSKDPAILSGVDTIVRDILRTKIVSGMMDGQPAYNKSDINSAGAKQLALKTAEESTVLLKNANKILPIDTSKIKSIALIGPSAKVAQMGDHGSSNVNAAYGITPYQGLKNLLGSGVTINYAMGCDIDSASTTGFADAIAAAKKSDLVIYVGGLDWNEEGEGHDRSGGSADLPGEQQELINQLAAANSNVVVVLEGGAPMGISKCISNIKGLLMAWYPGEEGGNAIANILLGKVNPSGKLNTTWQVDDSQLAPWTSDFTQDMEEGRGYRWFDMQNITPQFCFGYGLSYTTFSYGNLKIDKSSIDSDQKVKVSVDVTNTGSVAGDEIPQLYLGFPSCGVTMPPKQLKGFQRVTLQPGETKTVTFTVTPDDMSYFDTASESYKVPLGQFKVMAGSSSRDLPLNGSFTVAKTVDSADLNVTELAWSPERVIFNGDTVTFNTTLSNDGTAAVPAGTAIKASFYVDGKKVAEASNSDGLGIGSTVTLTGSAAYTAVTGTHQIEVAVNEDGSVTESDDTDNSYTRVMSVKVYSGQEPVTVTTLKGTAPVMPGSVNLKFTDGTSILAPVTWKPIDSSLYSSDQDFTVTGTAAEGETVQATVRVVTQLPQIYEFENATLAGGVKVNTDHYGFTGTGFTDGWGTVGGSATLSFNEPTDGTADFVLHYGEGVSNCTLNLYINGKKQTTVTFPVVSSGNWDVWGTVTVPVKLYAGTNTVSFKYEKGNTGAVNLDNLTVENYLSNESSSSSAVSSQASSSSQAPVSSQAASSSQAPVSSQAASSSQAPVSSQASSSSQAPASSQAASSSQAPVSSSSKAASSSSSKASVSSTGESSEETQSYAPVIGDNGSSETGTVSSGSSSAASGQSNPGTGDIPVSMISLAMLSAGVAVIISRKKLH